MADVDEIEVQTVVRARMTTRLSLTELVPVEKIADEYIAKEGEPPRIAIHLVMREPAHFDQTGRVSHWRFTFWIVVEDVQSDRLRRIVSEVVQAYSGGAFVVPGCRTNGIRVLRVDGAVYDPDSRRRGRNVVIETIVQPAG